MNDSGRLVLNMVLICAFVLFAFAILLCAQGNFTGASALFCAAAATVASALYCRRELSKVKKEKDAAEARALLEQENASAALSEAKDKILSYHSLISHGLRIPISVIMGYADILMGKMVADEAVRDEYLRKMCEKAAYMNELLTYSLLEMRYDTGTFSPAHKQFEIMSMLRGVTDAMGEMASAAGIDIRLVSEQREIFIRGNAIGLSKVFYNIIENAVKYMGGFGILNITAALLAEGEALIVFKDDGPGVSAEDATRIFERNYQGTNARGGDGLGLWIAKAEVESHGGSIEAKTGDGKGMGIYITLPAAGAPEKNITFDR
ncbi:MAG: HAMP domain-containing histidine kinase [Clostridiales Family XIII bacterium]|jgi:signal transduction histidine kinase|nr:HAMP domain-containing histidine kinase [Clostridiales Family XIII bacterium]